MPNRSQLQTQTVKTLNASGPPYLKCAGHPHTTCRHLQQLTHKLKRQCTLPPSQKICSYHGSDDTVTSTHSKNDLFAICTIKLTTTHSRQWRIHKLQLCNVLSSLHIWLHGLDNHNFQQTLSKLQIRNKPAPTKHIHKKTAWRHCHTSV